MSKKKHKAEDVSVSFHSMFREVKKEGNVEKVAFSKEEFLKIFQSLKEQKVFDLNNEEDSDKVRYRQVAPIAKVELVNEKIICGQYKASYWGHSYENSRKGMIDSDSINLRPFFFLLYLADNGRIYVSSQYLGHFGGYTALKNTILLGIEKPSTVTSVSFNIGNVSFEGLEPRELKVTFSKKETKITGKPKVSKAGVLVFQKQGKDDPFGEQIKDKLFVKKSKGELKKAVSSLVNASGMFELNEEDIDDCKILATRTKGGTTTVFLLDESNYATRFPLNVKLEEDGHPVYNEIKPKVISVLTNRILSLSKK